MKQPMCISHVSPRTCGPCGSSRLIVTVDHYLYSEQWGSELGYEVWEQAAVEPQVVLRWCLSPPAMCANQKQFMQADMSGSQAGNDGQVVWYVVNHVD